MVFGRTQEAAHDGTVVAAGRRAATVILLTRPCWLLARGGISLPRRKWWRATYHAGGAVPETSGYSIEERPLLDATLSMPVTQARDKGNGKGNETHGIDLSGQLNSSSVSPGASVSQALPSPSQRQCSTEWTDGVTTPPEAFPDTMPEFAAS